MQKHRKAERGFRFSVKRQFPVKKDFLPDGQEALFIHKACWMRAIPLHAAFEDGQHIFLLQQLGGAFGAAHAHGAFVGHVV